MRVTAATKEQTRLRILESAAKLFLNRGFANTTTRDIASAAEIAVGTLFNYFPTKEALGMALIEDALATGQAEFQDRLRGDESLTEALFAHIAIGLRRLRPQRGYVGEIFEAAMSPFAQSTAMTVGNAVRERHLDVVRNLIEKHSPASTPVPNLVAIHLYWTLYLGVVAFWSRDESSNQEDTLALLDQALHIFVSTLNAGHPSAEVNHAT